jgi:hypothetical protein
MAKGGPCNSSGDCPVTMPAPVIILPPKIKIKINSSMLIKKEFPEKWDVIY